jgi:microcystin-dependent protein
MSTAFVGEIRIFGGNYAPFGWAFCDGRLIPISENQALYSLIGTTFGGDGINTFALPDLRGRLPMHTGSEFPLGEAAGDESVELTTGQLPSHQHPPAAVSGPGNTGSPQGAVWAAAGAGSYYGTGNVDSPMNAGAVQATGSGQPHDNLSPFQVVTFIIALDGVYPSRS